LQPGGGSSSEHKCTYAPIIFCKKIKRKSKLAACNCVRSEYKQLTLGYGELGFTQQEGNGRGVRTWLKLIAGDGLHEDLA